MPVILDNQSIIVFVLLNWVNWRHQEDGFGSLTSCNFYNWRIEKVLSVGINIETAKDLTKNSAISQ